MSSRRRSECGHAHKQQRNDSPFGPEDACMLHDPGPARQQPRARARQCLRSQASTYVPDCAAEYAREHDQAVEVSSTLCCGDVASPLPSTAASTSQLPLGCGGLCVPQRTAYTPFPLAQLLGEAEQLPASMNAPHAGMPPARAGVLCRSLPPQGSTVHSTLGGNRRV